MMPISFGVQTQTLADNSLADNSEASEPKKAEVAKPSLVDSVTCTPSKDGPANTAPVDPERGCNSSAKPESRPASQSPRTEGWRFQFAPYFWLAGLHGTTGTPNRSVHFSESFRDIFGTLQFALMGVFEARKNRFVTITDVEYVSLEDEKATPGPLFSTVDARVKTFIFNPEVGYRFFEDSGKGRFVEVHGGVRVWRLSTDFSFGPGILPATQVDGHRSWVDAVVGLAGKATLSEKVFLTGKFDLGGGGSKFTYRIFGGLGYQVTEKIPVIFGYRVLDVDYNRDNFVYDTNQRGPIVGVGFKF
jgi:hypothetical protein